MSPNTNTNSTEMHPAVAGVLRFFTYDHLPKRAQQISKKYADVAQWAAKEKDLDGPELTVSLRKLLEAKDAAVRAAI